MTGLIGESWNLCRTGRTAERAGEGDLEGTKGDGGQAQAWLEAAWLEATSSGPG